MNKKYTKEEFIIKANKKHKNKYIYDNINYINSKTYIDIICLKHGIFKQTPSSHLTGRGCPKCGYNSFGECVNDKTFIEKSFIIHNNKYNYSLVEYKNNKTNVKIICPDHGIFEQTPNNHLNGKGCGKCGKTKKLELSDFLYKSNNIHNFKYDYSLVKFKNVKTKVKIICPIHNIIFEQTPNHHMKGVGCPICNESSGERKIRIFFEKNNILFKRNKKFTNCKYKRQLSFDFYLPEYNICIEYDGIQHFADIPFWSNNLVEQIIKDNIKTNYCVENNIKLIRISYLDNIFEKLFFLEKIKTN